MALKQINTTDQNLQLIQDNINSALGGNTTQIQKLTDSNGKVTFDKTQISPPFVNGNFLFDVSLSAGKDNLVSHGLDRLPRLWVICTQTVNTTLWEVQTTALSVPSGPKKISQRSSSEQYLNLWCGTDCVVHLWIN